MKKLLCMLLPLCLLISACSIREGEPEAKKYTATFLTLFDTVTTVVGYAESEEAFQSHAQAVHDQLSVYHRLFDIYTSYENTVNLKTVNDTAGIAPVKVPEEIFQLLTDLKEICRMTDGKVNAAMGSVLSLWHDAREKSLLSPDSAFIPGEAALKEAALHIDFDKVILNPEASTVYFEDPAIRLDVGAVAKGWAVEQVARAMPSGLLISVGGNVRATGPRDPEGGQWIIGIQHPDHADKHLHTMYLTNGSLVTSGDYQRSYRVDSRDYHHIIDPETLYPADRWRSVTVYTQDSGTADALSTALFLMTLEEGQRLLQKFGAEAVWMDRKGDLFYSPGFKDHIRT